MSATIAGNLAQLFRLCVCSLGVLAMTYVPELARFTTRLERSKENR